jgi:hypothetical protein
LKATGNIDRCRLINWTEPEYPQTLLQIYDPPSTALRSRRSGSPESPLPQHCGNQTPDSVRHADGGTPRPRTRRARLSG